MTLSITTLCNECHFAECHISAIVILNVSMLSVIRLSVSMLSVIRLSVTMLSVMLVSS
jgi:hypothetical protein